MNKKDIKLGDTLYWNTFGAFSSKISLECEVIDIGELWIWVLVNGNLAYNNLLSNELSKEPLYRVTNSRLKDKMNKLGKDYLEEGIRSSRPVNKSIGKD